MILLCGIPSESPFSMVREQLDRLGALCVMFNQRHFADTELEFEIAGGRVTGSLRLGNCSYRLEEVQGVYLRLMDDRLLPELRDEPENSPKRRHCRALHDTLTHWCEIAPARVVNRAAPMGSNFSKPYQAQLIRAQDFAVPETLITNDPERVIAFREQHERVIYKSISAVRSIVQTLEDHDIARLDHIRWCPTQFQAYVRGTNVRVHVVGEAVFATAILSDAIDYRYAHRQAGSHADLCAVDLPDEICAQCVGLAQALDLAFAGIDLKITPEGRVYCFEVNPSPAFSYYESNTGQPIAAGVACYLASAEK